MTAASSPPPHDGEVCACGHRLAHHVSVGGCCIGACLCLAPRPAAPSEPPATDSPTPGMETPVDENGCPRSPHHGVDCPGDACRYAQPPAEARHRNVAHPIPGEWCPPGCFRQDTPAEAQQDDDEHPKAKQLRLLTAAQSTRRRLYDNLRPEARRAAHAVDECFHEEPGQTRPCPQCVADEVLSAVLTALTALDAR